MAPSGSRCAPKTIVLLSGKIGSVQKTCFRLAWHTSHRVESTDRRGDMASLEAYVYAGSLGFRRASSATRCEALQSYLGSSEGATVARYSIQASWLWMARVYSWSKCKSIELSTLSGASSFVSTRRLGGKYRDSPVADAQHVCDWLPLVHTQPYAADDGAGQVALICRSCASTDCWKTLVLALGPVLRAAKKLLTKYLVRDCRAGLPHVYGRLLTVRQL